MKHKTSNVVLRAFADTSIVHITAAIICLLDSLVPARHLSNRNPFNDIIYLLNILSGALNSTHSLTHCCQE